MVHYWYIILFVVTTGATKAYRHLCKYIHIVRWGEMQCVEVYRRMMRRHLVACTIRLRMIVW